MGKFLKEYNYYSTSTNQKLEDDPVSIHPINRQPQVTTKIPSTTLINSDDDGIPYISYKKVLELVGPRDNEDNGFSKDDISMLNDIGFKIINKTKAVGSYGDAIIDITLDENNRYNLKFEKQGKSFSVGGRPKETLYELLISVRNKLPFGIKKFNSFTSYSTYSTIDKDKLPRSGGMYSGVNNSEFSDNDIKKLKYIGFKILNNDSAIGKIYGRSGYGSTTENTITIKIHLPNFGSCSYQLKIGNWSEESFSNLYNALLKIKRRYRGTENIKRIR